MKKETVKILLLLIDVVGSIGVSLVLYWCMDDLRTGMSMAVGVLFFAIMRRKNGI